MSSRDADRIFHETWLGLAQPIEGLVFSVPVLAEAQIAPAARPEITSQISSQCEALPDDRLALRSVRGFFESFLGYSLPGSLIERASLPTFYAPESGQEVRASFAIARKPLTQANDPFAEFSPPPGTAASDDGSNPLLALIWDLTDDARDGLNIDLDKPETVTGVWHYPPTAKLERLLRHTGIPIGFISNRRELRVVYAPAGETTSHLTFRIDDLADPAGRPIALALELIFHARRTYGSDAKYTFEGLLTESRRRQADVTDQLARQVFDAVETLLAGFEAAAARDCTAGRVDWMSAALGADHVHEGVLNAVLRLVFVLYAEDRSLLPVDHRLYAEHFSLLALYERLVHDAGSHPESMHHRFGAYGALTTLFRAIFFGVRHGTLHLPPRQGKLFDPSAYPFLEGGLPDWTAAVNRAEDRAQVLLPSVDDKTIHDVLHGLIVLDGQRLSYRDLSVEQIGAVYESLMGYRVQKLMGPAVRLGKNGVWVEVRELRTASKQDQNKLLEDRCEVTAASIKSILAVLADHPDDDVAADAIAALAGKKGQLRNRARIGQLVMQPTASRRSTGSHYTPRSLSERVVRRTLDPVIACLGESPIADQILQLKVCDPAMGSGAFLVEACRYLAERIVEAWRRTGDLPVMLERHGEPLLYAKRLVAERCLYGVDKNPAAVELAKLSVWLETLSADRPFTFLDHVLRCGDSLIGLDLEQIRSFRWSPDKQLPTIALLVDQVLAEVREHRHAIQELADDDREEAQREKRRLLELADLALGRVKLVADVCIGAFFARADTKAREEERLRRCAIVEMWLSGADDLRSTVDRWSGEIHREHSPFHWHLEFPEVFFIERPDPLDSGRVNGLALVDAFVGNPPFASGLTLSTQFGNNFVHWQKDSLSLRNAKIDLSALFFLRCSQLVGTHGTLGMIATNTIKQGATREECLVRLETSAWVIYDAVSSMPWPGNAAVAISIVHLARGYAVKQVDSSRRLDGVEVKAISTHLTARSGADRAVPIQVNAGLAFQGAIIQGAGFLISEVERRRLLRDCPEAENLLLSFVGGDDVNTSPTHVSDRFVIAFGERNLEEAEQYPALLDVVRERVKPERDALRDDQATARLAKARWWQFWAPRTEAFSAIRKLSRCLVCSVVTKHLSFAFVPTSAIYSQTLYVFAFDHATQFSILQSRIHELWARLQSSSLEERLRYLASKCFATFPFPFADPRESVESLEAIGHSLHESRARFMVDTNQGLTQIYNRLKDPCCDEPSILHLRRMHEDMDRAVLDAYGWTDLEVPPFCPLTAEEQKMLEHFQNAVIDRLFVLNAQRADEEKRLGASAKAAKSKSSSTKRASKRKTEAAISQSQLSLDDAGDDA